MIKKYIIIISVVMSAWCNQGGVFVSFKPIASIVMYLLDGSDIHVYSMSHDHTSHHHVQLSHHDIERIQKSCLFISLGSLYESFSLKKIRIPCHVVIEDIKGLRLLKKRDQGQGYDGHFFLSIYNIKIIAKFLSSQCQKIYPHHQKLIEKNCESFCKNIEVLKTQSFQKISKCSKKEYAISHDFLQYIDDEMGTKGTLFLFKGCSHHLSPRAMKRFKDEKFDSIIVDEEMPKLKTFAHTVLINYTGRGYLLSKNLFFDIYRHIIDQTVFLFNNVFGN